jgi:hypothetical protein
MGIISETSTSQGGIFAAGSGGTPSSGPTRTEADGKRKTATINQVAMNSTSWSFFATECRNSR